MERHSISVTEAKRAVILKYDMEKSVMQGSGLAEYSEYVASNAFRTALHVYKQHLNSPASKEE